jgi:membrane protein YqaA with SNARE-associated domain
VAGIWGLAEATFFFIVPDVWISYVALTERRRARIACLWALAGALLGGILMFSWGWRDPGAALAAIERVPEVSPAKCGRVLEQIRRHGAVAIFLGPLTGTPYKIYAVQSAAARVDPVFFLLISVPARVLRFLLVAEITILLCGWASRTSKRARILTHLTVWIAFYALRTWLMSRG